MNPRRKAGRARKAPGAKNTAASPFSASVARIVQMTASPDCNVVELGDVIAVDPVFGLRVLSLANSSAFSLRRRMSDVRQAVTMLGLRSVRNLALGLLVSDMAPQSEEGERLLEQAIRRGTACRLIGEQLGVEELDEFFTAGLLLDVGLLTLARTDAHLAADLAAMSSASRAVRERANGLPPHAEVSANMALECSLPETMVAAIESHHDPEPGESKLERAAWLAERVAALFDSAMVARDHALLEEAARTIGITADALENVLERTPEEVARTAEGFQRKLPPQQTIDELTANAYQQLVDLNREYESLVFELEQALAVKSKLESELRLANQRLAGLASTDELTRLPNRRALQESMDYQLSVTERTGRPLSLIMLDVDHFKSFNDTMGHAAGDAVLRMLGQLLNDIVRGGDFPARYGGEEFTVMLPDTDRDGAIVAAERIRCRLEQTRVTEDVPRPCNVTASFGIATTLGGESAESLFQRADHALYEAKRRGRNRVCAAHSQGTQSAAAA